MRTNNNKTINNIYSENKFINHKTHIMIRMYKPTGRNKSEWPSRSRTLSIHNIL